MTDFVLNEYQKEMKCKLSIRLNGEETSGNIHQDKFALSTYLLENSLPKISLHSDEEIMEVRKIKAENSEKTNTIPNFGIYREGSSCYINSTLQALSGLDKVTEFIGKYFKESLLMNSSQESNRNESQMDNLVNAVEYTRNPQISPEAVRKFHGDFVNQKFGGSEASPLNIMDVFEY